MVAFSYGTLWIISFLAYQPYDTFYSQGALATHILTAGGSISLFFLFFFLEHISSLWLDTV